MRIACFFLAAVSLSLFSSMAYPCETSEECRKELQKLIPSYGVPQGSQSLEELAERNYRSSAYISALKELSFDKFIEDNYGGLVEAESVKMMEEYILTLSDAEKRKLSNKNSVDKFTADFVVKIEPIIENKVRDWFRRDYPNTPWGEAPGWQGTLSRTMPNSSSGYNNQYFKGFKCRIDCSGHHAGYEWAKNNSLNAEYECDQHIGMIDRVQSPSFYEGCLAFAREY